MLIDAVKSAVKYSVCVGTDAGQWVARKLATVNDTAAYVDEKLQTFEASYCSGDPSSISSNAQPALFEGGQCEGANYQYVANYTVSLSNGAVLTNQSVGMVSGFGVVTSVDVIIDPANSKRVRLEMVGSTGTTYSQPTSYGYSVAAITDKIITCLNCANNDCGDPPSPPVPSDEGAYSTTANIEYTDANNVLQQFPDSPIKFFKPCVNLDGIRIPFEIEVNGLKLCGKVGFRPDLTNVLEPDIDIDECPSQKQDAGIQPVEMADYFDVTAPTLNADPEFGGHVPFIETDTPVLGVLISATRNNTSVYTQTAIFAATDSPVLLPDIGTIRFLLNIPTGENDNVLSYSEPIRIKQARCFIPVPWEFGALGYEVTPRANWNISVGEARRKTCCDACASADPNAGLDNLDRCRID